MGDCRRRKVATAPWMSRGGAASAVVVVRSGCAFGLAVALATWRVSPCDLRDVPGAWMKKQKKSRLAGGSLRLPCRHASTVVAPAAQPPGQDDHADAGDGAQPDIGVGEGAKQGVHIDRIEHA